jgi:hypothetical protein
MQRRGFGASAPSREEIMSSLRLVLFGIICAAASQIVCAETRKFVVSWVYYAVSSRDGDCPGGLNPDSVGIFRRILKERNTPPDKIEQFVADFPNSAAVADIGHRGSIDGKPADVYRYPTSVPDPHLHHVQGTYGLGFDLDGKIGRDDFVDPLTGEKGVDNQFFRAIGCSSQMRAPVGQPGVYQAVQYDEVRDSQPAWLVEISGIDSLEKSDNVKVHVMLAREPVARDVTGAPQADMTFHVDPVTRTAGNVVRGTIRNGLLTTDKFNFYMPGEPRIQAEYDFKDARLRFQFMPNGTLKGYIGGYQDWRSVYASIALAGITYELLASYDTPGMFYAFRELADAYPDPKTGQNTRISSTYATDAIPAFIVEPSALQTAEAK